MASQLARQLGPRGGALGGVPKSGLHTHTHDRIDKLRSALAEAQLKMDGGRGRASLVLPISATGCSHLICYAN